jgi:hypothetical protein
MALEVFLKELQARYSNKSLKRSRLFFNFRKGLFYDKMLNSDVLSAFTKTLVDFWAKIGQF